MNRSTADDAWRPSLKRWFWRHSTLFQSAIPLLFRERDNQFPFAPFSSRLRACPVPTFQIEHIGQQKRQLQTLRRVQPWIAVGVVPVGQCFRRDRHRAKRSRPSNQLQAYLAPHRRRRAGQGVEADRGVGGIEQAIERAAAGVHALGHRDLGQLSGVSFCAFIASPS